MDWFLNTPQNLEKQRRRQENEHGITLCRLHLEPHRDNNLGNKSNQYLISISYSLGTVGHCCNYHFKKFLSFESKANERVVNQSLVGLRLVSKDHTVAVTGIQRKQINFHSSVMSGCLVYALACLLERMYKLTFRFHATKTNA